MAKSSWAPTESVSFWINRVSRSLVRAQDDALRPLGFSIGQLSVLRTLKDGEPVSLIELARNAGVEPPSMTQVVARMERDGIVRRVPNPNDGRSALVSLTDSAAKRLPAARKALMEVEKNAIASLSPKDRDLLTDLLKKVGERLGMASDVSIASFQK